MSLFGCLSACLLRSPGFLSGAFRFSGLRLVVACVPLPLISSTWPRWEWEVDARFHAKWNDVIPKFVFHPVNGL